MPTPDGDHTMDHTTAVFLMDKDRQFKGLIGYDSDQAKRVLQLRFYDVVKFSAP